MGNIQTFQVDMEKMKHITEREHVCLCATILSEKRCPCEQFFALNEGETCKCGVYTRLALKWNEG